MLSIHDIPNEILVSIFSSFPTETLLPLVVISRRFHALILRVLHFRLLLAAELPEYKLILEAYHPSRKNTEPYLFCTYLGTDGLSSKQEGEGSIYEDCKGAEGRFAKLGALYSRFRPENPGVTGTIPLRRIAGAQPVQSQSGNTSQPLYTNSGDGGKKKVAHSLNLDADELFGQFCVYSSLVRLGPKRGVFLSTVHIVKSGAGVIRVWKEWLKERSEEYQQYDAEFERSVTNTYSEIGTDKDMMWTDYKRNVGLKVDVVDNQKKLSPNPTEVSVELPSSYSIVIRELVVRTTHLMLAVEASVDEHHNRSGKAMIFGNFGTVRST